MFLVGTAKGHIAEMLVPPLKKPLRVLWQGAADREGLQERQRQG
jgi:hypothetical protein